MTATSTTTPPMRAIRSWISEVIHDGGGVSRQSRRTAYLRCLSHRRAPASCGIGSGWGTAPYADPGRVWRLHPRRRRRRAQHDCPSLLHLPCTSFPGRKVDGGGRPASGEWVAEPDLLGLDVGEYGFEDRAEVLIRCIVGPHGERSTRDDMSGCGS